MANSMILLTMSDGVWSLLKSFDTACRTNIPGLCDKDGYMYAISFVAAPRNVFLTLKHSFSD